MSRGSVLYPLSIPLGVASEQRQPPPLWYGLKQTKQARGPLAFLIQWLETRPSNMKTEECALRGQGCMLYDGFPDEPQVPGQQLDRITIIIFVFRMSLPNPSPQMLA